MTIITKRKSAENVETRPTSDKFAYVNPVHGKPESRESRNIKHTSASPTDWRKVYPTAFQSGRGSFAFINPACDTIMPTTPGRRPRVRGTTRV